MSAIVHKGWLRQARNGLVWATAATALVVTSAPAAAQDDDDARVRKLELEVRALQRKVFPGGDGRFFEPEIVPPARNMNTPEPGVQSTSALTDVLARLDALEAQMQRMTSQIELGQNALSEMTERIDAIEANVRAGQTQPDLPTEGPIDTDAVVGTAAAAGSSAANAPDPARLARVQAITKPATGDPADDEYVYGYRLWEAKLYPEAQQQLTRFVEAHPNHSRTTFGRNLLGRAYFDDGKPRDAAPWFLSNYQADKQAARAGDSLLYLAKTMIALDDTSRACIALAEFGDTYPALAVGRLASEYQAARQQVTCN